jgi:hypothetical protein
LKKRKTNYATEPSSSGQKSDMGDPRGEKLELLRQELKEDGKDFTNCKHP